jgi:predicted NBD/HSP70 family sugar kinase
MPAIDQPGMRRTNRRTVLRVLAHRRETVTTADLVADTGLSRRTVELILAELLEDGWVVESAAPEGVRTAGRPRRYFDIVPERALVLTFSYSDAVVTAWVTDLHGRTVAGESAEVSSPDPSAFSAAAVTVGRAALSRAGAAPEALRVVVLGLAGTVETAGVVLTSPLGADWVGLDVGRPLREAFGAPVVVENNTNLSALAEYASGAARDTPTFVLLVPGNRVAAGVVIGGEVYRGVEGAAGELLRIPAIDLAAAREHPVAMLSSEAPELSAAARGLLLRAEAGDPDAERLTGEFFDATARLVATIGWILAPPVVVLKGTFDGIEQIVLERLRSALAVVDAPRMDLRLAVHGADSVLRGGGRLGLDVVAAEFFDAVG